MRVLLAEGHADIAASVAKGLRLQSVVVDVAVDGARARFLARVYPYDVVVLGRGLPEVHGDDVSRVLHAEQPGLKILILTAAGRAEDIVGGLGSATTT